MRTAIFSRKSVGTDTKKFSTFEGVFLPTLLTILGAVMYLRTGWVVGEAGLIGAWLIIGLANMITICTGLSISTIATNIRVGAGGSFSIISQSLGLEVGGSVNLPFYFAQAISVAFYIFAFSEGWLSIFPTHSQAVIVLVAYAACFSIAFISVGLAAQIRYPILFIISFSLFSILLGAFPRFGHPGAVYTPQLFGDFPDSSFWMVFAVFFPAVTGILAGVNLSGTLQNPRKSIPSGTMAAVIISFIVYLSLAYWSSRVAAPEELQTNYTIMVDKAAWGWVVQAGILAATFSAALNSLVGAPRVLQAMAAHKVVPFGNTLARETEKGEPRPAMYVTGAIGIGTLLFGLAGEGLNQIAPLMTMFFLITYAILNGEVMLEQALQLTSFRPLFQIPRLVPLIGFVGAVFVMFLINPVFSIVSIIVIVVLYEYLSLQRLTSPWTDVRSGMFVTMAEWAAKRVLQMPTGQDRAWKPSLLVPVESATALRHNYRFLEAITKPNGSLHIYGCYREDNLGEIEAIRNYERAFANDGIFARVALLESSSFNQTMRTAMEVSSSTFFRPNTLFYSLQDDSDDDALQYLLNHASQNNIGMLLYADNPQAGLGREQIINVWLREQSPNWQVGLRLPNLDLTLLLAYQLARNWQGTINLITVVAQESNRESAESYLAQLMDWGRMPKGTQIVVGVGDFDRFLDSAPDADLNMFGLQMHVNVALMRHLLAATGTTCVFIRDSGTESALV
ncbi:MAG: amino acid permease [Anaerolineae bacterium]|nr:amino acid permease [Anaerolineae bacterium]MCO5205246.1 amino acid permease [Anaerolineae bacterium]